MASNWPLDIASRLSIGAMFRPAQPLARAALGWFGLSPFHNCDFSLRFVEDKKGVCLDRFFQGFIVPHFNLACFSLALSVRTTSTPKLDMRHSFSLSGSQLYFLTDSDGTLVPGLWLRGVEEARGAAGQSLVNVGMFSQTCSTSMASLGIAP